MPTAQGRPHAGERGHCRGEEGARTPSGHLQTCSSPARQGAAGRPAHRDAAHVGRHGLDSGVRAPARQRAGCTWGRGPRGGRAGRACSWPRRPRRHARRCRASQAKRPASSLATASAARRSATSCRGARRVGRQCGKPSGANGMQAAGAGRGRCACAGWRALYDERRAGCRQQQQQRQARQAAAGPPPHLPVTPFGQRCTGSCVHGQPCTCPRCACTRGPRLLQPALARQRAGVAVPRAANGRTAREALRAAARAVRRRQRVCQRLRGRRPAGVREPGWQRRLLRQLPSQALPPDAPALAQVQKPLPGSARLWQRTVPSELHPGAHAEVALGT